MGVFYVTVTCTQTYFLQSKPPNGVITIRSTNCEAIRRPRFVLTASSHSVKEHASPEASPPSTMSFSRQALVLWTFLVVELFSWHFPSRTTGKIGTVDNYAIVKGTLNLKIPSNVVAEQQQDCCQTMVWFVSHKTTQLFCNYKDLFVMSTSTHPTPLKKGDRRP